MPNWSAARGCQFHSKAAWNVPAVSLSLSLTWRCKPKGFIVQTGQLARLTCMTNERATPTSCLAHLTECAHRQPDLHRSKYFPRTRNMQTTLLSPRSCNQSNGQTPTVGLQWLLLRHLLLENIHTEMGELTHTQTHQNHCKR